MKKILINQPFGLGDIIFIMPIVQKFMNDGHEVIFPIRKEYLGNASIQKNFPKISFIPVEEFTTYKYYDKYVNCFEDDTYKYFPFKYSEILTNDLSIHMGYKYTLAGLSYDMWRTVKITRDMFAENKLINFLKITPGEKFNLINNRYHHTRKIQRNNMNVITNNDYRNIYMSSEENYNLFDYNLFDWMSVIEKATTIHTVHTSIQYLIEILPNITTDVHIYPRIEEKCDGHSAYNYLFKKKYTYH